MLVTVSSAILRGVTGLPVQVEVHVTDSLPGFTVLGAPDVTCREARDRIRAALLTSGFTWPRGRITVNLTPTGLPAAGAALDLPIALGVLAADGQLNAELLAGMAFVGELGLDGSLRPTRGVLPLVEAFEHTPTTVVVPPANLPEARSTGHPYLRTAADLAALVAALRYQTPWTTPEVDPTEPHPAPQVPDLAEVRAEPLTVLALEVAAAGGHHLLLVGPHGAGTTLLARVAASLAPPLQPGETEGTARVRSAAGLPFTREHHRPFRTPRPATSVLAMIGGAGPTLAPGELSLAHNGTLFLDDLTEHPATTFDAITAALDHGTVRVSRGATTATLPARFQLITAMAPCPGRHPDQPCTCTGAALARYRRRVPAQLLDHLAVRVALQPPSPTDAPAHHDTATAARRVAAAQARLLAGPTEPVLDPDAYSLLDHHIRAGTLSARARHHVIAVAHTIAALNDHPGLVDHDTIALALLLRPTVHQLLPHTT